MWAGRMAMAMCLAGRKGNDNAQATPPSPPPHPTHHHHHHTTHRHIHTHATLADENDAYRQPTHMQAFGDIEYVHAQQLPCWNLQEGSTAHMHACMHAHTVHAGAYCLTTTIRSITYIVPRTAPCRGSTVQPGGCRSTRPCMHARLWDGS